ncbi:barstar family protein [Cellulomonas sp. IC4_254]|uniref:barstar family protein n=1 Tax=Cellulomonas sp. IC4_254 TaxID=2714040 RepID=UPI00141FA3D1|nr:barstar family protein [Cellulomonas sp. IC4_254]
MVVDDESRSSGAVFTELLPEPGDVRTLSDRLLGQGFRCVVLDGARMRADRGVFSEFASLLEFPGYFGFNWSALEDCLTDLDWFATPRGYVLVLLSADDVLLDQPDRLQTLVGLLHRAAAVWQSPVAIGEAWDRDAVSFRVMLQVSEKGRGRWIAAGAELGAEGL